MNDRQSTITAKQTNNKNIHKTNNNNKNNNIKI